MAILGRKRFNARLLTSIIQSAAKLKYDDEALTDKLSENLLQRMHRLDAVEVTDLVQLFRIDMLRFATGRRRHRVVFWVSIEWFQRN